MLETCGDPNKPKPPLWFMIHDGQVVLYEGKEPYLRKSHWTGWEVARMQLGIWEILNPGFVANDYPWCLANSEPQALDYPGRSHGPETTATV